MRVLVTGGAGFIGSCFVRDMLNGAGDHQVTVLDKLTYAGTLTSLAPVRDRPELTFVRGDVADRALVNSLVPGHDAIVHFAAESHVDRSIRDGAAFVTTNVLGTQTILDAALRHGIAPVVHVSTDEVYGSIEVGAWPETDPLCPRSPYAATKASADLLAMAYHHTYGLDVRVTRCCNTYGPYQFPEKIIPLFITNLLEGRRVPLYGDGLNVRSWIHVEDHSRAVLAVLCGGRPGEVYNVDGGDGLSNKELTDRLLTACGATWDMVDHVTDRPGHDRRYALDATKISRDLGFRPLRDFDSGLAGTVRWYRQNRSWWEPLKESGGAP